MRAKTLHPAASTPVGIASSKSGTRPFACPVYSMCMQETPKFVTPRATKHHVQTGPSHGRGTIAESLQYREHHLICSFPAPPRLGISQVHSSHSIKAERENAKAFSPIYLPIFQKFPGTEKKFSPLLPQRKGSCIFGWELKGWEGRRKRKI